MMSGNQTANIAIEILLKKKVGFKILTPKEKTKTPRISKQSENIITELQQLDYTSQGFRYPYDKSGKRFFENTKEEDLKQANMMTEFMSRVNIVFSDLENQEGDFTADDEVESLD